MEDQATYLVNTVQKVTVPENPELDRYNAKCAQLRNKIILLAEELNLGSYTTMFIKGPFSNCDEWLNGYYEALLDIKLKQLDEQYANRNEVSEYISKILPLSRELNVKKSALEFIDSLPTSQQLFGYYNALLDLKHHKEI